MTRSTPELLKEVHYITDSGETHSLAEFQGTEWCIKGTHGSFKLCRSSGNDGHLFELVGHKMVNVSALVWLFINPSSKIYYLNKLSITLILRIL